MFVLQGIAALLLLAAAGYAQYRVPFHTITAGRTNLVRAVMALAGLALGYVATFYAADTPGAIVAFLTGFGIVHLPAAVILFVKHGRGSGKS